MQTFEGWYKEANAPHPRNTDVFTDKGTLIDMSVMWLYQPKSVKAKVRAENAKKNEKPKPITVPKAAPAVVTAPPPMDFVEDLVYEEPSIWSGWSFSWMKKAVGPVLAAMLIGGFGLSSANAQPIEIAQKRVKATATPCTLHLERGKPHHENGQLIYDCGGKLIQAGTLQLVGGKLVTTQIKPFVEEPMPDGDYNDPTID